MSKVLLYSGGLDSLIAWYMLDKPETLYVDLKHRYAQKELLSIGNLPIKPIIKISNYGLYFEKPNAHIPGRNLLLAMFAAGLGFDEIYLVAQKGEQNIPDRTPYFFQETSKVLSFHFEKDIQFLNGAPEYYKTEMVEWYISNDLPVEDLLISVSCYSSGEGHCGKCSSCFRKWVSLTLNGVDCDSIFRENIAEWGVGNYLDRLDVYDEYRKNEILKVYGMGG